MSIKHINYNVVEDRILSVLDENKENDITGVAFILIKQVEYSTKIELDVLYDFCEHYGCSLDYLLGRTDRYWL